MKQALNETHKHIFEVAEQLFATRGYDSVRLRDIATAVGIKHAALYYYVPDGKEQLFVDVMERSFQRHYRGMLDVVAAAAPDLRKQLVAVADWLLAHPPLNVAHLEQSDFSAISEENAQKLSNMIFDSLRLPLREALEAAQARGEITLSDVDLAALSFITLVESIHNTTNSFLAQRKRETVDMMIDMLLNGWLTR
jgi:AcrR family transcriptional regulator